MRSLARLFSSSRRAPPKAASKRCSSSACFSAWVFMTSVYSCEPWVKGLIPRRRPSGFTCTSSRMPSCCTTRSRNSYIARNFQVVSTCSSGKGGGAGWNAFTARCSITALSLPMEYSITGRSHSATTSRRMWMLSASSRCRWVRAAAAGNALPAVACVPGVSLAARLMSQTPSARARRTPEVTNGRNPRPRVGLRPDHETSLRGAPDKRNSLKNGRCRARTEPVGRAVAEMRRSNWRQLPGRALLAGVLRHAQVLLCGCLLGILFSVPLAADTTETTETAAPAPKPPPANPTEDQLTEVIVQTTEPRFVAPTRRDRIGRIWAPVLIDGKGPYRLVLDTGANRSAITTRAAQSLGGVPAVGNTQVTGFTGSAMVPTLHVSRLEVGDLLIGPSDLPV